MNHGDRVLIVGAGVGGLAAGAALAERGIEARIIEVKPEPNVYGVGINQPANALRALNSLGVLQEVLDVGYVFDRWTFHDHRGNLVVDCPSKLGGPGIPPNNGLSRRDLHSILIGAAQRAGVGVRYGTTVTELVEEGDGVHVTLSDGAVEQYELVVGFDGINS